MSITTERAAKRSVTQTKSNQAPLGAAWLAGWTGQLLTALPLIVSLAWLGGTFRRAYGPTHYFLNYQHGFLKRALLGELLLPLHYISLRQILAIELAIFALLAAVTYIVFRRLLLGSMEERALAAFLLAAPAVLPHFAYLSGDLDSVLYICTVLAVGALLSLPASWPAAIAVAATLLLSGVAILVHEGFVLLFYPVLLAIMIDQVRRRRLPAALVAGQLVLVGIAFVAVLHFGKWTMPHPEYLAAAQQRSDMPLEGTVFLVLSSTLQQQLHFVAALYTPRLIAGILFSCLVSLPYFAMLVWLLRRGMEARGYLSRHCWLLFALLCAPLLLLPLGHDAMRWISAVCVNLTLFLLYLYRSAEALAERRALTAWTQTPLYGAMLGYALALGAFGIASNRLVSHLGDLLSGHP